MMDFAPTTTPELMRQQQQDIRSLKRRANPTLRVGSLESRVDSLETRGYMRRTRLKPLNGWRLYSDSVPSDPWAAYGDAGSPGDAALNSTSATSGNVNVTCTSTGIVTVEALVQITTAPAAKTAIVQLPPELWPTRTQYFTGLCSGGWANLIVTWDGQILWDGSQSSAVNWTTLNDIGFRTKASVDAGIATFVPLTLSTGWAEYTSAYYTGDKTGAGSHTPGYTLDAEGVILFEGSAICTVARAANADFGQATGLQSQPYVSHQMMRSSGGVLNGRYGAAAGSAGSTAQGNYLNVLPAATVGVVVSIANMIAVEPNRLLTWKATYTFNSWVAYGGAWEVPGFTKTADSLVIARGLWGAGTIGSVMAIMPRRWRSRYEGLHSVASNGTQGRMDSFPSRYIGQATAQPPGSIGATTGSNVWYSLAGTRWAAYEGDEL